MAARVLALAGRNEILVTSTARDARVGTDVTFECTADTHRAAWRALGSSIEMRQSTRPGRRIALILALGLVLGFRTQLAAAKDPLQGELHHGAEGL
jgi:hypothetical protein